MPATTTRAERKAEVRTRAMPADTNPAGDIFGRLVDVTDDLAIRQDSGDEVPVTAGVFVYVALGQDGHPVAVPEEV